MQPQFDLSGQNILITGGAGYLGRAIAVSLASSGATVLINGRCIERCEALADDLWSHDSDLIDPRNWTDVS